MSRMRRAGDETTVMKQAQSAACVVMLRLDFLESVPSVTCLEGDAEVGDALIVLGSSYKGSYIACSC